jgi:hypothetical protein
VSVALAYGWLRSVDDNKKTLLRLEVWERNPAVLCEGRGDANETRPEDRRDPDIVMLDWMFNRWWPESQDPGIPNK